MKKIKSLVAALLNIGVLGAVTVVLGLFYNAIS